jgi:regulatory protein
LPGRRGRKTPAEPPNAEAALEVAARFLGSRPRTRWEVERRLRGAGVAEDVVTATLDRLADLGYLDDAAFVRWWLEQRDRHSPRGRRMLEDELRQRGVSREVIEEFREAYAAPERGLDGEQLPATDEGRARVALERHLRGRPVPTDPWSLQRLGAFLMRRGFDRDTVRAALSAASRAEADEPA